MPAELWQLIFRIGKLTEDEVFVALCALYVAYPEIEHICAEYVNDLRVAALGEVSSDFSVWAQTLARPMRTSVIPCFLPTRELICGGPNLTKEEAWGLITGYFETVRKASFVCIPLHDSLSIEQAFRLSCAGRRPLEVLISCDGFSVRSAFQDAQQVDFRVLSHIGDAEDHLWRAYAAIESPMDKLTWLIDQIQPSQILWDSRRTKLLKFIILNTMSSFNNVLPRCMRTSFGWVFTGPSWTVLRIKTIWLTLASYWRSQTQIGTDETTSLFIQGANRISVSWGGKVVLVEAELFNLGLPCGLDTQFAFDCHMGTGASFDQVCSRIATDWPRESYNISEDAWAEYRLFLYLVEKYTNPTRGYFV